MNSETQLLEHCAIMRRRNQLKILHSRIFEAEQHVFRLKEKFSNDRRSVDLDERAYWYKYEQVKRTRPISTPTQTILNTVLTDLNISEEKLMAMLKGKS